MESTHVLNYYCLLLGPLKSPRTVPSLETNSVYNCQGLEDKRQLKITMVHSSPVAGASSN